VSRSAGVSRSASGVAQPAVALWLRRIVVVLWLVAGVAVLLLVCYIAVTVGAVG